MVEKVILAFPDCPSLVVITITPFAALLPHRAAADAPFKTCTEAISAGLRSFNLDPKLTAPELELPPFTILVILLFNGDPSTIINGSLLPKMVFAPRIRILLPAPGSPLDLVTLKPAAFALNALAKVASPDL